MPQTLIQSLLPPSAAGADTRADAPDDTLHPLERAALPTGASEGRRREFTTVRACAREALAALGQPPAPLLPDARGVPHWPRGIVGSMTHCRGYRAAVVAREGDVPALGVDAEPCEPLREGVLRTISRPGERERLRLLGALRHRPECWDRLLFCAKEAVFKAWFPLTRTELAFQDVSVVLDAAGQSFRARVLVPGGREYTGRWLAREGLLAAVAFGGGPDRRVSART
ncbi:4'-phosphopantetheinyl transferase superfamily protein [Streptomyces sp. NPDC047046]|uniref:4'-phosphopantetheinyl transferase family protein n=1 Tax=Streptomyces sp. NPDC047046 TaxID=3155378 RepID=UPI0033D72DD7